MQVRLYRATGEARNYIDGYTLYFPYPKFMVQRMREIYGPTTLIKGFFLGCSPASDGTMIRCNWEDYEVGKYPYYVNFGKKIDIKTMPEPFQKEVRRMEKLYNEALKYDDQEHWDKWNREG